MLYLAVPDKRLTFDVKREPTPVEHFLKDHQEGPAWSYDSHVDEYVRLVDDIPRGPLYDQRVAEIKNTDYSIHFHVWTEQSLREFFLLLQDRLRLPLRLLVVAHHPDRGENIAVLRKT